VTRGEEERENWLRATVLLSDKPEPVKAVPNGGLSWIPVVDNYSKHNNAFGFANMK